MTPETQSSILIVEDDPDIQNLLRLYLEKLDYAPICLDDPQQALARMQSDDFPLIILDWNLPGMTGVELTRHLRRHASHAQSYILMITTHSRPEEIARALEAGVDDYLIKPVTPELLRVRVQIAEQRVRLTRSAIEELARPAEKEATWVGPGPAIESSDSSNSSGANSAGPPAAASSSEGSESGIDSIRDAQRRTENSLLLHRYYDPLTGLANRTLMLEILDSHLHQYQSLDDYAFAVVCLDLKRFNLINDSLGYEIGDLVLLRAARRIEGLLLNHDVLARPGADRFVIMLSELRNEGDVDGLLNDLKEAFREPFRVEDQEIFLDFSAGVVLPQDQTYERPEDILRAAETALHDAKQNSANGIQYFSDFMQNRARIKLSLESELRRALQNMDFEVNYQPIVSARAGRVTGLEALIRWRHPEYGEISPGQFVPIAEESGLIEPITRWVLETSCRQVKELGNSMNGDAPYVSVNIASRLFLEDELDGMIQSALSASGLAAGSLVLEVTETSAMKYPRKTRQILDRLLALGVQVSIDDFGTGYSSLAYLRQFPVHYLKIDRSFLKEVGDNRNNAAIAGAIIALGEALELSVVAEGVETSAQLDFLARHNCDFMQGFYFSKPVPMETIPERISSIRAIFAAEQAASGRPASVTGYTN